MFGNPFKTKNRAADVKKFREWLKGSIYEFQNERGMILANLGTLKGKNLACWCDFNGKCHADVLLEMANGLTIRWNNK